jgi:hypothetical protein
MVGRAWPPPAGARIFIGEDYRTVLANLGGNLKEGRAVTLEVVCRAV